MVAHPPCAKSTHFQATTLLHRTFGTNHLVEKSLSIKVELYLRLRLQALTF